MQLRGVNFQPVWDASGVRNFFGEGYPYHWPLKPFGLNFKGSTFVAKTTTLLPREGKMPLVKIGKHWYPREIKPACIYVDRKQGLALNAVSLSGPGAAALFATGCGKSASSRSCFRSCRWKRPWTSAAKNSADSWKCFASSCRTSTLRSAYR